VLAVLFTEPLVAIVTVWMSKGVMDTSLRKLSASLRPAILASGLMAAAVWSSKALLAQQSELIQLITAVLVGMMVYAATLRLGFVDELNEAIRLLTGKSRD
jgi:hypothetical protein